MCIMRLLIKSYIHVFVAGAFSRSAVNYNAGCKIAVSNIVMATTVMIVLLFLTPLFHYTPLVVLSSIIVIKVYAYNDYITYKIDLIKIKVHAINKKDKSILITNYTTE